ncbi:FAD-dependent oxidoreductase [Acrocarpospora catenulata]|uniref:FAD-dependent oxidoreductase n=1 Tax=Acrocarpospora catenulata TaxID=2836182 RepID=UPI001BDB0A3D|nr:FAD-dependent monooxygenase [Acrocarpospora catenulata]
MGTNDSAVVIGAGIGGLLAARVLSDAFPRVTVFDRDELPAATVPRRGVPQGHQAQALLAKGCEIVEELFPGFTDDLVGRGATALDIQQDARWYFGGRLLRAAPSELRALALSRPLLEGYLRERVAARTGVQINASSEVVGLLAEESNRSVRGVRVLRGGAEQDFDADLVVDASGRGNRGETWLRSLGYEPPQEERVEPKLAYSTRQYRRPPGDDTEPVIVNATVTCPRGGIAVWAEGERWLVTLTGMGDDTPSADPEEFTAFAADLAKPDIYHLIRRLEPLGPPKRMRIPASVRRRYERLRSLPDGYLAFADALCQFNPVYAQGVTVAAAEAMELRHCLAQGRDKLAPRFFKAASKVIDAAWDMSVTGDLAYPGVVGQRTGRIRFINGYLDWVHAAAETDSVVGNAFLSVANLMTPPQFLFSPPILGRVLRRRIGRGTGARPVATAGITE